MTDKIDQNILQPLCVETENSTQNLSDFYEEEKNNYISNNSNDNGDSLGPLPAKWEKAYTESGEVYFIDHSSGTSHWLDPRLSKFQKKKLEDCLDDELPYGWEKISDPHYGTYFIDHVNRRTQYENPVIQAKRAASQASAYTTRNSFTSNPSELCGEQIKTSLVKSSRGLGFTIVGGDDGVDEFLQIKSVVPKGPAWLDGQLQTGDVIVYVNDICVLGYAHSQIVRLFQSISVGSMVTIEVCRGYPLPFDPNDPNTEVVTTIAVDENVQPLADEKCHLDSNFNFLGMENKSDIDKSGLDTSVELDEFLTGMNNLALGKLEVQVKIIKGNLGFGFTIADSACGQRVKKILDQQRCKNLMEGDILLQINDILLENMPHDDVVHVLKNCPYNSEAVIRVQRGYMNKVTNGKNKSKKLDLRLGAKENVPGHRSKTPTADIYSTQPREILPSRPKTPLVDTRGIPTSNKDINLNSSYNMLRDNENSNGERSRLRLPSVDSLEDDPELDENQKKSECEYPPVLETNIGLYMPIPHRYDCSCVYCLDMKSGTMELDGSYSQRKVYSRDWWMQTNRNVEYVTTAVTLHRQENGFGFRIIGGMEDKSQVAVGHIVPGGAADLDGRIRSGDEIVSVEGISVLKASHQQVVGLINAAAARGEVSLILRRAMTPQMHSMNPSYTGMNTWSPDDSHNLDDAMVSNANVGSTYDVTVQRTENEGFGFVIISSANKTGSTVGRLIEDSPAERCGKLRVGDYIVAVNHIDIMPLSHGDIVNLIKESGLCVTLTIAPSPNL